MQHVINVVITSILLITCISATVPSRAEKQPKPNSWKGLVLNESTPDDARKLFGQPVKEVVTQLYSHVLGNWRPSSHKEKTFLTLEYKKVGGTKRTYLQYQNNKLYLIFLQFEDQSLRPDNIAESYKTPLYPKLAIFSNISMESFVKAHKVAIDQGRITPMRYSTTYDLFGLSTESTIICSVAISPFESNVGSSVSFPGKVYSLTLISRVDSDFRNVDVLK